MDAVTTTRLPLLISNSINSIQGLPNDPEMNMTYGPRIIQTFKQLHTKFYSHESVTKHVIQQHTSNHGNNIIIVS